MNCSRCRASIPAQSTFCNHCGAKQRPDEAPASAGRWVIVVAGAVLATGALSAVLASGALDGYLAAFDDKPKPSGAAAPTSGAAPASGAAPTSSPKTKAQPSSDAIAKPTAAAFTINLDSDPPGATVTELDGSAIGQTPASVVLPETTIVVFSLAGFDDTCRYELSSKLKDQTIKCKFKKPSKDAPNPDSKTPEPPKNPTSGPSKPEKATDPSLSPDKPKAPPSSGPSKKRPSSGPSR